MADSLLWSSYAGIHISGGASARIERNEVTDCEIGLLIVDVSESLVVEGNAVRENGGVGVWLSRTCPAAFALGATNRLEANSAGDVSDGRS